MDTLSDNCVLLIAENRQTLNLPGARLPVTSPEDAAELAREWSRRYPHTSHRFDAWLRWNGEHHRLNRDGQEVNR